MSCTREFEDIFNFSVYTYSMISAVEPRNIVTPIVMYVEFINTYPHITGITPNIMLGEITAI